MKPQGVVYTVKTDWMVIEFVANTMPIANALASYLAPGSGSKLNSRPTCTLAGENAKIQL